MISNGIASQGDVEIPNRRKLSNLVWQWGQFLDHDISLTDNDIVNGTAEIPVDPGDILGPNPIPFSRSNYDQGTGLGRANPREQINQITAYIDASHVYGSDPARAAALRTGQNGQLRTSDGNLLPLNEAGFANHGGTDPSLFLAGDIRANEQVGLTAMHTLFVREHNRLAGLLAQQVPAADDELVYQTARKIVGAEIQIITYNEFLPALLGDYSPKAVDFSYDSDANPTIANEFSTGLYRLGHSLLSPSHYLMRSGEDVVDKLALKDAFFNPDYLKNDPDRVGQLLMGLSKQMAQEVDNKVVDDVRNFLFGPPGAGGLDLAALNIQRGRDHGLPDYNSLRAAYGLTPKDTLADITSDPDAQTELASLYGDVNEIDPWVGMLAEEHLPGASLGELATTGLVDQFSRLRDGDRFFFINDADLWTDAVGSVIDLEHVTLSQIVSSNTGMANMPANLFVVPEPTSVALVLVGMLLLAAGLSLCQPPRSHIQHGPAHVQLQDLALDLDSPHQNPDLVA